MKLAFAGEKCLAREEEDHWLTMTYNNSNNNHNNINNKKDASEHVTFRFCSAAAGAQNLR
jgi:hypothetical protein